MPVGLLTGLEYFGGYQVNGLPDSQRSPSVRCDALLLRVGGRAVAPTVDGWERVAQFNQRTRNSEQIVVYRRPAAVAHP